MGRGQLSRGDACFASRDKRSAAATALRRLVVYMGKCTSKGSQYLDLNSRVYRKQRARLD